MFQQQHRPHRTQPEATTDAPQPTGGSLQQQAQKYANVARQIRRETQRDISAAEMLRRRRNESGQ